MVEPRSEITQVLRIADDMVRSPKDSRFIEASRQFIVAETFVRNLLDEAQDLEAKKLAEIDRVGEHEYIEELFKDDEETDVPDGPPDGEGDPEDEAPESVSDRQGETDQGS